MISLIMVSIVIHSHMCDVRQHVRSVILRLTVNVAFTHIGGYFMCGFRKFCQRGSKSDNVFSSFFFSLIRGGRTKIPLLVGHQRPVSETPFKLRFAGGSMMAQH